MCREESKAATAGADRFVSIAPCRSESADGGIARRTQGDAGRGEDSARRIIGGVAGGNRAGAQGSSDRECAEPVQHREPQVGKNAGLLRQGGPRLYAVVADWRKQGFETWRCVGSGGQNTRRECCSTRACLASATVARDAAHSRHVVYRAPGGKCRRGQDQVNSGRVEDDRCFGGEG